MAASEITEKLRVVILYDRLESVGRAMQAYAHLTRELDWASQPELSIWRLDVATTPAFAVKADLDIATAEIVLMAVRGDEPCPPAFQHWQERAWQDEGAPTRIWIALVVATPAPAPVVTTWTHALRLSATQIHPEIFVWEPVTECPPAAPAAPIGLVARAALDAAIATEHVPVGDYDAATHPAMSVLVAAHRE